MNRQQSENNIALLYKKHGFLIIEKEGFLLLSFGDANKVNIITYYVESPIPLSFEQVRQWYEKFLRLGRNNNCHQYRLICSGGFDDDTDFFSNVNLALSGKEYLESLQKINHIELYSHNDIAYTKLCNQLLSVGKACVIQPTGTGKSLILSKFISERYESKFVVLAPGRFIISQIRRHLLKRDHVRFLTYSKLTFFSEEEINNLKPDYIIVDEFHRCGAEEWGGGVQQLLQTYPNAKLIGTTATHIRYLDKKRNMADELFESNIAHHLTFSKALALGILPTPKYISALYKFDQDYIRVKKSIIESMAENKKVLLERLNKIKLEFDNTDSIPNILKKYLNGDIQKIIVFCKDIRHIRKHKDMVISWFNSIGYDNIQQYEVHSQNEPKNKDIFKNFEQKHENILDIMFSVNMLNEGIHVKGVNCIIMLRDTESPIIYYQQMGRCLTVGAESPLIFDFVNNFANIRHRDMLNDFNEEFNKLTELYKFKGIPYDQITFEVIDKVKDIKELFEEIESAAGSWNIFFEKLIDFKSEYGHYNVSIKFHDQWLAHKVSSIRGKYRKGLLNKELIDKLDEMGFQWNIIEQAWDLFIEKLTVFKNEYGHCNVSRTYPDQWLAIKVNSMRQCYKRSRLRKEKIDTLNEMGFQWYMRDEINDKNWDLFIEKLIVLKNEYGHCNVPKNFNDKWLSIKVMTVRKYYKKGKLKKEEIDMLNEIGFQWSVGRRPKKRLHLT